ncbi:MAG TPA: DNA internalization-related competence protein ComEC/Rec2, partial [Thiolapillus brandeum]|nr:DNA internalization-related competence protein ComEC/Rec2 [Thiolapillus brandeum]
RPAGRFSWLWLQLGIFLALAPVLVWQQLPVSVLSPLVNLLAIPVFALLMVPLSLGSVLAQMVAPDLGQLLMPLVGWLLDVFLLALDAVAQWLPPLQWGLFAVEILLLLGGLNLFLLWLAARRNWHPLWLMAFLSTASLCLLLFLQQPSAPAPNSFRFTLLDVGQGLSAVVRTARNVLVFDTGPGFPSGFNTGSAVLLPYFADQRISRIDRLILSHSDTDHVGGAKDVIQRMPVADVLSGEPSGLGIRQSVRRCVAGAVWWWDGVRFDVLYPFPGGTQEGNNASCVLKVSAAGQSVLITGDVEAQGENRLVKQVSDKLKSQVVVAAHHGSASSSTENFIDATDASYVLFAAGKNNRWGFPRPDVMERWLAHGAVLLNTADEGAIEFNLGAGEKAVPLSWFGVSRHYWHK